MTEPARPGGLTNTQPARPSGNGAGGSNLADILERVLDKGIVIAGDIQVNLLDIELLTIKLRLLVASVDKAKEMGIDWWEHDPSLSSSVRSEESARDKAVERDDARLAELQTENEQLQQRLAALEQAADSRQPTTDQGHSGSQDTRSGSDR